MKIFKLILGVLLQAFFDAFIISFIPQYGFGYKSFSHNDWIVMLTLTFVFVSRDFKLRKLNDRIEALEIKLRITENS